MMAGLGRVPATGDAFSWENWRLEVVDMDGNRVDKVLATPHEGVSPKRRNRVLHDGAPRPRCKLPSVERASAGSKKR